LLKKIIIKFIDQFVTFSSPLLIRRRFAQLAAHLVVALVALVVIGGATRVMEAGLACPDWPLCYGSVFPGHQMNIRVFLEWFHRLDACLVGLALLAQLALSILWRSKLPKWLPLVCTGLVILIVLQGSLGALTVLQLLPNELVTAHLFVALTLLAIVSAMSQCLLPSGKSHVPFWWRVLGGTSLIGVILQSVLGARVATTWSAHSCLHYGEACQLLFLHRNFSVIASISVFAFIFVPILLGGWSRSQWPFLMIVFGLIITQVFLGILAVNFELSKPYVVISHQLIAALLVAILSALTFLNPQPHLIKNLFKKDTSLESCHG